MRRPQFCGGRVLIESGHQTKSVTFPFEFEEKPEVCLTYEGTRTYTQSEIGTNPLFVLNITKTGFDIEINRIANNYGIAIHWIAVGEGVITRLLRALSHRWRHEQPDGITTTEDKVQGCNDTIHNNDWNRVRFHRRQISERNEQFSVCDSLGLWECFKSNMFRCERRRKLYSWRARKHNFTFNNTVFLHGLIADLRREVA